ncbi:hypothetical protein Pmani_038055 [Petrolisthes manimaculis]|uniref:Uncharacterized protein n=1 Tax=Petrolisthes manimaculis TaxID=1843537 RepID=A0AAE1TKT2_9EUCA|nr:hypothetical protein Pmani_038055 [Petrolisthes manimaculis]
MVVEGRQTDRGEQEGGKEQGGVVRQGRGKMNQGRGKGEMEGGGGALIQPSATHHLIPHPYIPRYHLTQPSIHPSIHPSHAPSSSIPLPTSPPPHVDGSRLSHEVTVFPVPFTLKSYPPRHLTPSSLQASTHLVTSPPHLSGIHPPRHLTPSSLRYPSTIPLCPYPSPLSSWVIDRGS